MGLQAGTTKQIVGMGMYQFNYIYVVIHLQLPFNTIT